MKSRLELIDSNWRSRGCSKAVYKNAIQSISLCFRPRENIAQELLAHHKLS